MFIKYLFIRTVRIFPLSITTFCEALLLFFLFVCVCVFFLFFCFVFFGYVLFCFVVAVLFLGVFLCLFVFVLLCVWGVWGCVCACVVFFLVVFAIFVIKIRIINTKIQYGSSYNNNHVIQNDISFLITTTIYISIYSSSSFHLPFKMYLVVYVYKISIKFLSPCSIL